MADTRLTPAVWDAFRNHLVFLLCLLPVIGAGMVLIVSRWGIDAIRRTVLTNIGITVAVAVLIVAQYDPEAKHRDGTPRTWQMCSEMNLLHWKAAAAEGTGVHDLPRLRVAVGVDGVSLWFVLLTPLLMFPAVRSSFGSDERHPALFYVLLLALEACLLGTFAARDVLLFCVLWESSLLTVFLLVGWWGGYERQKMATRVIPFQMAGALLVCAGLLGIVLAHARLQTAIGFESASITFSIEQLLDGNEQGPGLRAFRARLGAAFPSHWSSVAGWAFPMLLLGFAMRIPLVPFHTWYCNGSGEFPTAVNVLLTGTGLSAGAYGIVRFVVPFFAELLAAFGTWLLFLTIGGAVYAALVALAQSELRKQVTYVVVCHFCVCAAGVFSLNVLGVTGALVHLIGVGAAAAVWLTLAGSLQQRYRTLDIASYGGMVAKAPRLAIALTLTACGLAGVPFLGGFTGEVLTVLGVFRGREDTGVNVLGAAAALAAFMLLGWSLARTVQTTMFGPHHVSLPARGSADLTSTEVAALLPLLCLSVLLGIGPQVVVRRIEPTAAQVLIHVAPQTAPPIGETSPNQPSTGAVAESSAISSPHYANNSAQFTEDAGGND